VIAKLSSPFYHSAAMDGYAVRFIDTFGASETKPKRLSIPAQAVAVDTGDPMPDGYDAVIMIEDVEKLSGPEIEILKPATPWQHVGSWARTSCHGTHHFREPYGPAADMAAMIASGHTTVMVRAGLSSPSPGTELVDPAASSKKAISSISIRPCLRPWQRSAARMLSAGTL
jgi:putative molybdopterin biosynthesis protein